MLVATTWNVAGRRDEGEVLGIVVRSRGLFPTCGRYGTAAVTGPE